MTVISLPPHGFASDNNSGACPEALTAIADAAGGHAKGYGDDPWTEAAIRRIREEFGRPDAGVWFVLNGTGANVFALSLASGQGRAVLCGMGAHIDEDETGAPEAVVGCKVIPLDGPGGKIAPEALRAALAILGHEHSAQPSCVSITQPTERGELYTLEEVSALAAIAHGSGLFLHMDGARLANACAALGTGLAAATCDAGVDVLSFGGMKDGLAFGECVVTFRPELARLAPFLRKAVLQLDSKMRFVSAQYLAWLESGAWLRNAKAANRAAADLAARLEGIPGVEVVNSVRTNAVFARLPAGVADTLRSRTFFYDMEPGLSRFMANFDTTDGDVERFAADLRSLCAAAGS